MTYIDRWIREQRRAERPGEPDEIYLRSFTNNLGEQHYLIEARSAGVHCGDKVIKTHPDAVAFANMEAKWHGAKLIDHVAKRA